jgi:hypothetical protein
VDPPKKARLDEVRDANGRQCGPGVPNPNPCSKGGTGELADFKDSSPTVRTSSATVGWIAITRVKVVAVIPAGIASIRIGGRTPRLRLRAGQTQVLVLGAEDVAVEAVDPLAPARGHIEVADGF